MILVRDVFQLKFGKAKDAVALWKSILPFMQKGSNANYRMLTDLVGNYYTLVVEGTYSGMNEYQEAMSQMNADEESKAAFAEFYSQFVPLVESGNRDIWNVIE